MKKVVTLVLSVITVLSLCFALVACNAGSGNSSVESKPESESKLESESVIAESKLESGNVVAEGKFDEGVSLSALKIEAENENYAEVIAKVADKEYDKGKVAVIDISLLKDEAKVQPNGKVKITMPAPFETANGYVTYHIKGETTEELVTFLENGKISFETSGFSYFVVAGTTGGGIIGPDIPVNPDNNFFAYADGFEQGTLTAGGTAVKKGGYAAKLAEGQTIELVASANEGYEMLGWYKNEKASGSNEKYEDQSGNTTTFTYSGTENMYVYARFDIIEYAITVNLNGGEYKEGETIPATYNVESDTITLPTPQKGTAEFLGWTDENGNTVTEIAKGSTGDVTLTAQWETPAYVRVDKNKNPDENGEYVLFGSYPQTAVDRYDSTTLSALKELAGTNPSDGYNGNWTSYKYYYAKPLEGGDTEPSNEIDFMWYIDVNYKGEQYRGVYFDKYRPAVAKTSNGFLKDGKTELITRAQITNKYFVDNVYWFKYEPILWKIVGEAEGKARLLCMTALDCQPYTLVIRYDTEPLHDKERDDNYTLCYNDSPGVPTGTLGTNYEHSTVRDWLNNCFYQKAFDSAEQSIVCDTVVDNVTGDVGNNTTDKVFIPSVAEVKDEENLLRKASDYAKSQGTSMQYGDTYCYAWNLRDTYYVLRFQDNKDVYVQDHKRYYQLCSVKGGILYAKKDVPCFESAEGTSNAIVPSLWITL